MKSSSIELSVIKPGKIPEIVFTKKTTLLFKKALSPEEFIVESFDSLTKLLDNEKTNLLQLLSPHPDCRFVTHSPWFLPEIEKIEAKGQKTKLKSLIDEEIEESEEKGHKQIENKITNIMVQGYRLNEIRDITTDDLEINIFRSYLAREVVESLEKIMKGSLPNIGKIKFSSSAMQIYELIKNLYVSENNCCFINIGGELTEFGIIEDDILIRFSSFTIGKHVFSRELNEFIDEKENVDLIKFIGDDNSNFSLNKDAQKKLKSISLGWIENLKRIIEEYPGEIPKRTFIVDNSDSLDFFENILESSELTNELFFVPIKPNIFEGEIKFKDAKSKGVEYLISGYYSQIAD
jgi:hypothetical protein